MVKKALKVLLAAVIGFVSGAVFIFNALMKLDGVLTVFKRAISDLVDKLLFGSPWYGPRSRSYYQYRSPYVNRPVRYSDFYVNRPAASPYRFTDIEFKYKTKEDAEEVLSYIREHLQKFGQIRVTDIANYVYAHFDYINPEMHHDADDELGYTEDDHIDGVESCVDVWYINYPDCPHFVR